jgi:DNA-directed RNA polymerase I subunit RPA1
MDIIFNSSHAIDISTIPLAISFSFFSAREIKDLSVTEVFCPIFYDKKGDSVIGGLCDPKMGISGRKSKCSTCQENYVSCPGHYGHINFAIPLKNPFLKNIFLKIIKAKCWYCNFFRFSNWKTKLFFFKFLLIETEIRFKTKCLEKIFIFKNSTNLEKRNNSKKKKNKIFRSIKYATSNIKKNWRLEHFPKIKILKGNKKDKFWFYYMNNFLKLSYQKKFCQKCGKFKIVPLKFEDDYRIVYEAILLIEKYIKFFKNGFIFSSKNFFSKNFEKSSQVFSFKNFQINSKNFQLKKQIDYLWANEKDFCEFIWGTIGTLARFFKKNYAYIFFLSSLLVPPNRFRPIFFSKLKEKKSLIDLNPQNFYLTKSLKLNQQILLSIGSKNINLDKIFGIYIFSKLEKTLENLFDSFINFSKKKKNLVPGIRQRLEKKFGLFRMYLMGKRVFHSARSIIIPDPFLESFEVGVPLKIAKNLTSSITINYLNFNKFPFLNIESYFKKKYNFRQILFESFYGKKYLLKSTEKSFLELKVWDNLINKKKFSIIREKRIYGINRFKKRIKTNDMVLLNRQPSLHRASIMSHFVRIFKGIKCIKIHYSNCIPYNADFDGDEMNVHLPQNQIAESECLLLSGTYKHNKIPTHRITIRGLIQDNIISAVLLTQKNTFLNNSFFFHLIALII